MASKNYPMGVDLIAEGKCPRGEISEMSCIFCMQGHMAECHYPELCRDAQCNHHKVMAQLEQDHYRILEEQGKERHGA
ncbi:MAG: hypothetical protein M0Z52_07465 [Actinomycetota bacterium]|nr:hypothetical protein [Actinomycetota bacterium]